MNKIGDGYNAFKEFFSCGAQFIPVLGEPFGTICRDMKKRRMVFKIQQEDKCYKCDATVRYNGRIVSMNCEPLNSCDYELGKEEIREGYFGRYIKPY